MIGNYSNKLLVGTLVLIIVSSSLGNVFAQSIPQLAVDTVSPEVMPDVYETGRYSLADPNGSGVGEMSPSEDKRKHYDYYYPDKTDRKNSEVATSNVAANILNGCNCVVFRMDDVQDYWLSNVQVTVMDQFVQKNQFLSVGPIVGYFGADATVVNKAIAGYNSGLYEIYVHGWAHDDYSTLDLATQTSTLQDSQDKLQLLFGTTANAFVPPYNEFNADTLTALQSAGINIISSAEYADPYPYFIADGTSDITDSLGIYHLPGSIGFTEWVGGVPNRVSNSQILTSIDSAISEKGYAVVTIHPQEFAQIQDGIAINVVDQNFLADLNSVIDSILLNYSIKTYSQIVEFNQSSLPDTEPPVIAPHSDVNAVATSESGAVVSYTSPSTSDNIDAPGVATCSPLSGTTFAIGSTTVTCNATDAAGNAAVPTTFNVNVSDVPDASLQIAGWRSSQYGNIGEFGHDQSDPAYWISVAQQMSAKFPGFTPGGIVIIGYIDGGVGDGHNTYLSFPKPPGTYPNVNFGNVDAIEPLLDAYDAAGLKVYLQVESADADVPMLMDLIMDRYKHHPSVIGFGVDVEWYHEADYPGWGRPLTDSEVNAWAAQVKTFDPNYSLMVKHWDESYLSNARPDNVLFLTDSEQIGSLYTAINEYVGWIDYFGDSQVGFQIGYPSDMFWWSTLNDPAAEIMNPVLAARPNANVGAIFWVDFSVLAAFPDTQTPTITISDVTQVEGDSGSNDFVFTVTRSTNTPAISVQYQTQDDTASSATDYTSIPSSTLNFANNGPLTQTITVSVNGDETFESNEAFIVNLSNCNGCNIIDAQGTGTITNDDSPQDTEPPVITPHSDVNAVATSESGAVVSYTSPSTSDNIDAPGVATCSPLSGTTFAIGSTTVTCNATDAAGNAAVPTTFNVNVSDLPPISILFSDDFESGFSKWTETGEGDWKLESPAEVQVPGKSSNLVAHSDNCDSTCTITMSNPIDLSSYSSATLSFWRFVDNGLDNGEYLKVELFDGSQWTTVSNWTHGAGDDNAWHHETVNLENYLGVNNFNVRFVTHESSFNEEVEIDDVIIDTTDSTPNTDDTQAPVITPIGTSTSIPFGSKYIELGATVTDNDPTYSETGTVGGDTVNTYIPGNYVITYNAPADAAGNIPVEQSITITVLEEIMPTLVLFSDAFESGFSKWTETGEGDWKLESPDEKQVPGHSSNLVAHSDNCDSTCTITMSNPIDLSSYSSATLSFWRYVDKDLDNGEYLKVELYDGSSWNTIANWTHNSGDDDTWHQETVDLNSYLGTSNFNLRFVTHESHQKEIVEIDDVEIVGLS